MSIVEVPDEEDDTSFWQWEEANRISSLAPEATQLMVAEPLGSGVKTEKVPPKWLKLFGAKWTLHGIKEARTELEAKAIQKNWIHKAWVEEVVNGMIKGFQCSEWINALEWLEELCQPKRYICQLSGSGRDLVTNVQIETLETQTQISTTALVDSRCTSSTISREFVKKHNIPTHATTAPITVYNVDRTKNQAGQITAFAELCIKIGDHTEWIDLAVTDLKDQTIFLGHDWLVWHNPLINWKTGKIVFARCHCQKMPITLPDANPYDKWDKELEEGDTILAIDFEEAIKIRAMHHTMNDLATKANADKKVKMFKEMIPEWCRDFKDLFDKDNFNELPEPKPWDHVIELTPNSNANLDCKVYPLNRTE